MATGLTEAPWDSQLVDDYTKDLNKQVMDKKNEGKRGLALLVGTTEDGPAGVMDDLETMEKAFTSLNLLVWKMKNRHSIQIASVLRAIAKYQFPEESYQFIIFYFSGHGASQDNHPYIHCKDRTTLSIEKGIVAPLSTENASPLEGLRRIFLFDCCLVNNSPESLACRQEDLSFPLFDNALVAFATSMTDKSKGHGEGGVWTNCLAKNMERNCPFTTILDLTWDDTVEETKRIFKEDVPQGPHYISSAGLFWLCDPRRDWDKDSEKCKKFLPVWIKD